MTWTKLSDDYPDDCWTLSDQAFRCHTEGLVWSNRKLLDLRLPMEDLVRATKRPEAAGELVDKGWWRIEGDCYVIRHHGAYQRLAEDVIAQQERARANGRKGGRPGKPTTQVGSDVGTPASNPQGQDRTGQALDGKPWLRAVGDNWPEIPTCSVCHGAVDPALGRTHPTCGEA